MELLNLFEITIQVSVLIIFIIITRKLFKKRLDPNIRYFLWIFVAIRILVPFRMEFSVELPKVLNNHAIHTLVSENKDVSLDNMTINTTLPETMVTTEPPIQSEGGGSHYKEKENAKNQITDNQHVESGYVQSGAAVSTELILMVLWLSGAVIMAQYLFVNNVRLFRELKGERREIGRLRGGLLLYGVQGYNCLAGILSPAVYVDEEQFDDAVIGDIIRHELQHYKVGDHYWQFLRVVCLILQWHNPFVWWAYFASKQDCELACDARVVRSMSSEERYHYGDSLLAVIEGSSLIKQATSFTTYMGESKIFMKERIKNIIQYKRKYAIGLLAGIICIAGLIGFVSFQVRADEEMPLDVSDVGENALGTETQSTGDSAAEKDHSPIDIDIEDYYITNTGSFFNLYYIDEDNVLWGCGENNCGQLGQGTQDYDFHEEFVKIADNVIHVDYSQNDFVIFLTEDHKLYGMGFAGCGVLQQYDTFDGWSAYTNREHYTMTTPCLLMEDVIYARCGGSDVACITEDSSVWIWGVVGYDGSPMYFLPEPVKVLENAAFITGGWYNHAALLTDGSVWTWGNNFSGNCGVPGSGIVGLPTKVAEDVVMVWTDSLEYNIGVYDIKEFGGFNKRGLENTIIQKRDGSYWICGAGVGTEEKVIPFYYETVDYSMVCTHEFLPLENGLQDIQTEYPEIIAPALSYDLSQADEEYIYYILSGGIYRYNKKTGEEKSLYKGIGNIWCMEKYQDRLYFIEQAGQSASYILGSVSVDGENQEAIQYVPSNCLGIYDNYLLVRFVSNNGDVDDTVYVLKDSEVTLLDGGYLIDYGLSRERKIDTDADGKKLMSLENGEVVLFEAAQDEYVRVAAYSDEYVFADILDQDGKPKQLLYYNLKENSSQLYDNENSLHIEIRGDWLVCYIYGETLEVVKLSLPL